MGISFLHGRHQVAQKLMSVFSPLNSPIDIVSPSIFSRKKSNITVFSFSDSWNGMTISVIIAIRPANINNFFMIYSLVNQFLFLVCPS